MFRFKKSIIIVASSLICSCGSNTKEGQLEEENKPTSGVVTVVFQNLKELTSTKSSFSIPTISLYNGYYTDQRGGLYKNTDDSKTFDFDLYMSESLLNYNHIDGYTYSYYVNPGDTVEVKLENGLPIAMSTNKQLKEYDLNLSIKFNLQRLYNTKFESFTLPMNFGLPEKDRSTTEEYILIYTDKEKYLDSLAQIQLISPHLLHLKKQEIEMDKLSANIYNTNYSFEEESFNDDKMLYASYQRFVYIYINNKYGKKNGYNALKTYDDLFVDKNIPRKTKLSFLYNILNDIGKQKARGECETKIQQFLQFSQDSVWSDLVQKIPYLQIIDSKDLILFDQQMKTLDFKELMDSYKGKVIYIDLWASWCAPCIASFPAGEEFRNRYKNKPVLFLYLAYNDQEKPWLEKVKQYNLNKDNAKSFLIASPKSEWVNKMDIKTIPRYLVYNKSGKLVNKNAPSVDNEELKKILDDLIKE